MPCSDGGPSITESIAADQRELEKKVKFLEALLCAFFRRTALDVDRGVATLFNVIDWNEAGITRTEAEEWWRRHQEIDRTRRAREMKTGLGE